MIKRQYPIEPKESGAEEVSLTYEEANALHYSAEYIIESVDSISRDERDVPLTQYITNA